MSHALTRVEAWLDKSWDTVSELVPRHVNQQRLRRIILDQVRNNRELQACEPESVFRACVTAANRGLEIGVMNSAFLVRYGKQCVMVPGYNGLIQLAHNSGTITAVNVYAVRMQDEVMQAGDGAVHVEFNPFDKNRGPVVGWVCVITMKDGSTQYTTMTLEEYQAVRPVHWEKTPHRTHPSEMGKKSCVRRALKMVPLTPEISDIIQQADHAEFQDAEVEIKHTGGNAATLDIVDEKLNAMADEEDQAEEPAPAPVASPEEEPTAVSPNRKGQRDWAVDLARANQLISLMSVEGMPHWERMTKYRKEMVLKRQLAEGIPDVDAFWTRAFEVFTPFDPSKVANWSTKQLDQFIRISQRGNPDHWQIAAEGGYRPNGGVVQPEPAEPPYDPLADE